MKNEKYHLPLKSLYILIAFALVIAALSGWSAYYFFSQYQSAENKISQSQNASGLNVPDIIVKVGKLIKLPGNESPTVAAVNDPAMLHDRPFFRRAMPGDKLLLYKESKLAFLYRPSDNKLIETGPFNFPEKNKSDIAFSQPETQNSVLGSQTESPENQPFKKDINVAVFNGTPVNSVLENFLLHIEKKYKEIHFTQKANAAKRNYINTFIIASPSVNQDQLKSLADGFDSEISALPEGEKMPDNADILVILGNDKINYVK